MFWDYIFFSVGSALQQHDVQVQLSQWPEIKDYCSNYVVVADVGSVRIGSGGATIALLKSFIQESQEQKVDYSKLKVMIIHTGGLSQRLPHVSCYGKIFTTFCGGETALELKLRHYSKMEDLPAGVFVSASDVFEDMSAYKVDKIAADCEMLLFANHSDVQTGTGHGVFVMDSTDKLRSVLQKPSIKEMRSSGAIREDGMVLTDCVFWMNWSLCDRLAALNNEIEIKSEICCYGDFMRPLGYEPNLGYLAEGSENLQAWRIQIAHIFTQCRAQVIDLGIDSFYHFGTPSEFLAHFQKDSLYRRKMSSNSNTETGVSSQVRTIGNNSYIEYSRIPNFDVGENCIISGINSNYVGQIQNNLMVFTVPILDGTYVTVVFGIQDDIKKNEANLKWMEKETGLKNTSLWDARIFPKQNTREQSLNATLAMISTGIQNMDNATSMSQIYKWKNIENMAKYHQVPS